MTLLSVSGRVALVACASLALTPVAARPAHAADVSAVVWTASTCETPSDQQQQQASGLLGSLLGVVLGPLVQAGIKGLGEAIAKAGAPSDIHGTGTVSTDLYTIIVPTDVSAPFQPDLKLARSCLIAAFGPKGSTTQPGVLAQELQTAGAVPLAENGQWKEELSAKLGGALDASRMSVLVAELALSKDGSAFRLVPHYIALGNAFDAKTKERELSFTISLLPPGGTAEGTALAVRTIPFEGIAGPRRIEGAEAQASATSWMPIPTAPEALKARVSAAAQRMADGYALNYSLTHGTLKDAERTKATNDLARIRVLLGKDRVALETVAPYTVRVDAHQTRPGSPFLVKLGNFLAGNAEKIAGPVTDAIEPAKRNAAAETAAKDAETETQRVEGLRVTAITEAGNYAKAVSAGDTTGQRIAQIKLGAACRQIEAAGFSEAACIITP